MAMAVAPAAQLRVAIAGLSGIYLTRLLTYCFSCHYCKCEQGNIHCHEGALHHIKVQTVVLPPQGRACLLA